MLVLSNMEEAEEMECHVDAQAEISTTKKRRERRAWFPNNSETDQGARQRSPGNHKQGYNTQLSAQILKAYTSILNLEDISPSAFAIEKSAEG